MKKFLSIISKFAMATGLSLAFGLPGCFLVPLLGNAASDVLQKVGLFVLILPILLVAVNVVAASVYVKRKTKNVREMYDVFDAERNKIRADAAMARKKLVRLRVCITAYALFIFLANSFAAFVLVNTSHALLIVTTLVYYGMVYNLCATRDKPNFSEYARPEDYPAIYAVAQRAADATGVEGKIHIVCIPGGNVGIAKFGKHISLQIGSSMLAILREEELYNILLHEFAHVKNSDTDSIRSHKFVSFLSHDPASGANLFGIMMLLPYAMYTYQLELYMIFASLIVEGEADAAMASLCDRKTAANALYKTALYGYFESNIDLYMGHPFYESEECPSDLATRQIKQFFLILKEKESFWRDLLGREIQSRSASHPIFRTRVEALGVEDYEFTEPETEGAYRDECARAISEIDKRMYDSILPGYEEGHKNYLETLKTVEDWESEGRPYMVERMRDVLFAYVELERREQAYALCDEIIEKEENKGGLCAYAKFTRGSLRFEDYDPRAIEDLYEAANFNNNYIGEAVGKIGELCCTLGLADELERYRALAVDYAEKDFDESGTGTLSLRDKLEAETTLPPEVFERNLTAIKNASGDALRRVFLVRKKVTDTLYCSSYVIEFKKGTPEETVGDALDKIFQHLDNDPDDLQYSLFLYNKEYASVVSRVKGSCIYDGDKNT